MQVIDNTIKSLKGSSYIKQIWYFQLTFSRNTWNCVTGIAKNAYDPLLRPLSNSKELGHSVDSVDSLEEGSKIWGVEMPGNLTRMCCDSKKFKFIWFIMFVADSDKTKTKSNSIYFYYTILIRM